MILAELLPGRLEFTRILAKRVAYHCQRYGLQACEKLSVGTAEGGADNDFALNHCQSMCLKQQVVSPCDSMSHSRDTSVGFRIFAGWALRVRVQLGGMLVPFTSHAFHGTQPRHLSRVCCMRSLP